MTPGTVGRLIIREWAGQIACMNSALSWATFVCVFCGCSCKLTLFVTSLFLHSNTR
jgi:hypothetical protein